MKDNYKNVPIILQRNAVECAAACLCMIFAHYGKEVSLDQMCDETTVKKGYCSAGDIVRATERCGFSWTGYRKEPETLREFNMPCIVHWDFNHFVVLEGFKDGHVFINDPAIGERKLTEQEFDQSFTGVVLFLQPTDRSII